MRWKRAVAAASMLMAIGPGGFIGHAMAEDEFAKSFSLDAGPAIIEPDLPDRGPVRKDLDSYGGWTALKGQATGYFHVEQLGMRTWFITPEGNAFYMLNMGWAEKKDADRMKSWGFNSSEPNTGMPYTVEMHLLRVPSQQLPLQIPAGYPPWLTFPDVFDPAWEVNCREAVQKELAPHAEDPLMIGYYLDNEVGLNGWYDAVTATPKDSPCRKAFVEVARTYYGGDTAKLAKDWEKYSVTKFEDLLNVEGPPPGVSGLTTAWETAVAEKAWKTMSTLSREAAPHHLNRWPLRANVATSRHLPGNL